MRTVNEEWVQSTLEYIREYARENNGEVPVLSDIMKETGMVKSAAYRYLMILRDRGYIEYSGKGTLRLAGDNNCFRKYGSVKVPISTKQGIINELTEKNVNDNLLSTLEAILIIVV